MVLETIRAFVPPLLFLPSQPLLDRIQRVGWLSGKSYSS